MAEFKRNQFSGNVGPVGTATFYTYKHNGPLSDVTNPGFFEDAVKPGDIVYLYIDAGATGVGSLCYITGTLGSPSTYTLNQKYQG